MQDYLEGITIRSGLLPAQGDNKDKNNTKQHSANHKISKKY